MREFYLVSDFKRYVLEIDKNGYVTKNNGRPVGKKSKVTPTAGGKVNPDEINQNNDEDTEFTPFDEDFVSRLMENVDPIC